MDFESSYTPYLSEEKLKYLRLLAEKYPSMQIRTWTDIFVVCRT